MKNKITSLLAGLLICLFPITQLYAQSGLIVYEQIIDYGIEPNGNPRWDNFIKDLPKTGKAYFNLSFNESASLYVEDASKKEDTHPNLARAMRHGKFGRAPKPKLQQIYLNLEKEERVDQSEFMTRFFLIESNLEKPAWKLGTEHKKVLDYVCLGADLQVGDDVITAWFSPEIPVAVGPSNYYGLPGAVLAVEKNGEVFMLASSVEYQDGDDLFLVQAPAEGSKMSQAKFDRIMEEKLKEFEATRQKRGDGHRRHH